MFASSSPVKATGTGVTLIHSGRIPGILHSKELVLLCVFRAHAQEGQGDKGRQVPSGVSQLL